MKTRESAARAARKTLAAFASCCVFFLSSGAASAGTLAESGPERVSLVEVYSSEGCSSCPPAETWVSGLARDPRLWKGFVPVVFHVDYWDRLGWKDAFASPDFTARQGRYADAWGATSVYTPGFVLDGREWRPKGKGVPAAPGTAGRLSVETTASGYKASFVPGGPADGKFVAHAALLGMGIASDVTAGENSGRRLVHDFTVLDFAEKRMAGEGGRFETEFALDAARGPAARRLAIAVWVSDENDGPSPIQAAGAYVTGKQKETG